MSITERISTATGFLALAFTAGAVLFVLVRGLTYRWIKAEKGKPISKYWLIATFGYPVSLVYAFAIYPPAGFILLLPLLAFMVVPEIGMASWKAEPSVTLPKDVTLTKSLQRACDD